MPPRNDDEDDSNAEEEDDGEAEESDDAAADDEERELDAESDADGGVDVGEHEDGESEEPPRASWGDRMRRRARGAGGMGRRSTGPAPRAAAAKIRAVDVNAAPAVEGLPPTELAPDISSWPGTADAARTVGKHVSTIKLWRTQGRIRAIQDGSGCWRHHPDDLAEAVDTPDQTDPGTVLAQGMTAIVQQGSNANERLLAMTELTTEGLRTASTVLSEELKRAYSKIAELEKKLSETNDKLAATRELDLKHERYMRRLDQKHELEVSGSKETSARLEGLLTIIGPIAASIAARLIGNIEGAEKAEARAAGVREKNGQNGPIGQNGKKDPSSPTDPAVPADPAVSPVSPAPLYSKDDRLVPIETRITDAMSRLCIAIRHLDGPAFQGLRAMMPDGVQRALDDIVRGETDSAVGQALATVIKAAQGLSDLQFKTIRPIAPIDIVNVLSELRELLRVKEDKPS